MVSDALWVAMFAALALIHLVVLAMIGVAYIAGSLLAERVGVEFIVLSQLLGLPVLLGAAGGLYLSLERCCDYCDKWL